MAKILVIEDEAPLLEEVLDWLQFEGYDAAGAGDGRMGIDLALQHLPDLILSDIMMPGIDGHRVVAELRTHSATALTPFIFLTAKTNRDDVRRGMELGADDYLTKPFTREELLQVVQTQLSKRSMIEQYSQQAVAHLRKSLVHTLPHEFRTPLVSVLGYAEILQMDAETMDAAQVSDMAEHILAGGRRLYHLVENYLLFAQLEIIRYDSASVALLRETRCYSSDDYIKAVCGQIAEQHERVGDLVLRTAPATVRISDDDMRKIASELVDNAFKFSKKGTPVRVTTCVERGIFELRVTDQGRGMTREQVNGVGGLVQFDRAVYEQQGVGLGLTICRRLAELYGGALDMVSESGQGTEVTVRLAAIE